MEMMFFCRSLPNISQNPSISLSKARYFHCAGCATPCRSYVDRAERTFTPWSEGKSCGMNFLQLISTQPCSALVTRTTLPRAFAMCKVCLAVSANSASESRCSSEGTLCSCKLRPRSSSQVVGSIVLSQSKIRMVSSAEKVEVAPQSHSSSLQSNSEAASLPNSVEGMDSWSSTTRGGSALLSWVRVAQLWVWLKMQAIS
mmetsp:Transcript_106701/g.283826  ORF Transcript_106701/g.283826 Transcript_106701/m.283826 type:complete len:200 (-) Transcript_106701:109-708(-)